MSKRFIASPRNPRYAAQEWELRPMFGVTGHRWPKQGCPARCIQGIWVHVLPVDHESLRHPLKPGRAKRGHGHRCIAACPECGATVSAGRLAQHDCNARVNKTERLRRREFQRTLDHTRAQADLRALALAYRDAPFDTQDEDDAFNEFGEAATAIMTEAQQVEWHDWCLKATGDEIINEALRILGMAPMAPREPTNTRKDHDFPGFKEVST